MKRNIKKMALAAMLAGMLGSLTGCFIQPDPTLDPLQISDGTVPFGTVQALPTNTPTPGAAEHAKPHAGHVAIQRPEHVGGLVERQSADNHAQNGGDCRAGRAKLQTSTQDYNAGYPVLRVGSTGSDVSDLQARLTELGYYTGTIDGKYSTGTQSAVTEFQSRNGLTADGIAGRATQDKLYSASAQPRQSAPARRKAAIRCSRRAHPVWRCANCRAVWRSWGIMRAAWMAFTARRRPAL